MNFYERSQIGKTVTVSYPLAAVYGWSLYLGLLFLFVHYFLFPNYFGYILIGLAICLYPTMLKGRRELKSVMADKGLKVSGSRWSLKNPITYKFDIEE